MSKKSPLIEAARKLSAEAEKLRFAPPVTHIYNPLTYAWSAHEQYLARFGGAGKDWEDLLKNVLVLARAAKMFGVPVILNAVESGNYLFSALNGFIDAFRHKRPARLRRARASRFPRRSSRRS